MDAPRWLARHLAPGERVLWTQEPAPAAIWGAVGPLVGAALALAFAPTVMDMPGPLGFLLEPLRLAERAGIPAWLVMLSGAVGFVSLTAGHAMRENLAAWALTDRRLVRVVRYAPMATRTWPRAALRIDSVKLRKRGARVRIALPAGRFSWERTLDVEAREGAARLVAALAPAAPPEP